MSKTMSILLVEDRPTDATIIEREVRRTLPDSRYLRVETEADFLAALDSFRPDIILSDYTLPKFSGMAALKLAKRHVPEIPFILVTGSINEETAVTCMKAGAWDYLIKEHITRMGPAILNALEQKRLSDEALKSEHELRKNRSMMEAAFTSMADGLYISDLDGNCIECNEPFSVFHKCKDLENGSENFSDHSHLLKFYKQNGELVPQEMWPFQRALRGDTVTNDEYTLCREDTGETGEGSYSYSPVRDEQGNITGSVVVVRDISERRKTEAERDRFMKAIEQAGEVIVITDAQGTIQYVNPTFEQTSGYTCAEALGQNPRILKSGRHDGSFYREMWQVISNGETWRGRIDNKHKNGSIYNEEVTISPVLDSKGEIVNYVAVKHNITDTIKMEQQLQQSQKMESIGRLAGGVAHDFNNLLMGIMGYVDLCREKVESQPQVLEYLDFITDAAERSAAITRQLLAFARKQNIQPEELDLNKAITGMLKLLRQLLGEDIEVKWSPGEGPLVVKIDPSQIDQILANLTINARDAISGVGQLTLETQAVVIDESFEIPDENATPGNYVKLTVSDSGCGMDSETLGDIFEPFFTTKGIGQGTGLGLSTVYGIIKQNHGFVKVSSELGKGTSFNIYLPRLTITGNGAMASAPRTPIPHGTETILIAEDEKSILMTNKYFLETLGYTVLTAENPEEALRLVAEYSGKIHLLLTDVVMPGMNGVDLAKKLFEIQPEVKFLFMSGFTADVIMQRGIFEKDMNFMSKPFACDQLARKVREVLDRADS